MVKINQIVYLRNQNSAKYFAGFPIGFNIAIGGEDEMVMSPIMSFLYFVYSANMI